MTEPCDEVLYRKTESSLAEEVRVGRMKVCVIRGGVDCGTSGEEMNSVTEITEQGNDLSFMMRLGIFQYLVWYLLGAQNRVGVLNEIVFEVFLPMIIGKIRA